MTVNSLICGAATTVQAAALFVAVFGVLIVLWTDTDMSKPRRIWASVIFLAGVGSVFTISIFTGEFQYLFTCG